MPDSPAVCQALAAEIAQETDATRKAQLQTEYDERCGGGIVTPQGGGGGTTNPPEPGKNK